MMFAAGAPKSIGFFEHYIKSNESRLLKGKFYE